MYHRHSPKDWDDWSRAVNSSFDFPRQDAAFAPDVRSPAFRRRELNVLLRELRT